MQTKYMSAFSQAITLALRPVGIGCLATQRIKPTQTDTAPVIREDQVRSSPMPKEHQDLVIRHINRLNKIIYAREQRDIGRYTDRETAIRQLARMTIVFRRYMHMHKHSRLYFIRRFIGFEFESMVADLVDASFSVDKAARASSYAVIGSINYDHEHEVGFGEEQECERLVQEILAESVDQVSELWLIQPAWKGESILPDCSDGDDIGKDVDFEHFYAGKAADIEMVLRPNQLPEVLFGREKKQRVDLRWPPKLKTKESLVGMAATESTDPGNLRLE